MASTMKATMILLFLTAFTSIHVHTGDATNLCEVSDVHVSQVKTGKIVGGQPEYLVTFDNQCPCPVANVVVLCYGLDSTEPIDKAKIQVVLGHNCVINDAYPLVKGSPMSFTYAAKTPQSFPVVNLLSMCPRP